MNEIELLEAATVAELPNNRFADIILEAIGARYTCGQC
jgi:hypothetical protein